uniref:Uncharacterized protein n=1 Tax=Panagrolaimus sp. PS1159 TaxID=55785 RepID=A0AC35F0C6_9BILA
METLEAILNRLNISPIAENIDLNEFQIEAVAEMSVYQLSKNLRMDKQSAMKLHKELSVIRKSGGIKRQRLQPPFFPACKSQKYCETEFSSKFLNLEKVPYRAGDEWGMDICGAAFSASSNAFIRMFKIPDSAKQFGDANTYKNHKGWTPLMLATVMGRDNIVDLLLREKVTNYLAQNDDGQSAMMIAASFGHGEIIKLLYSRFGQHCKLFPNTSAHPSAIIHQQDKRGWSPLHYAAAHAQLDAIQILIGFGGNPNLPDLTKSTPTLLACEDELQESCLKLLLQAGGNLDLKNAQGKNGLEIAEFRESVNKMYQIYSKKFSHRNHSSPSSQYYGSF